MNEVHLKGSLYQTPVFQWVSGMKEAWIWLNADGRWLPVLCRGAAAETACQCPAGTQLAVTGLLETVQLPEAQLALRVLATSLQPMGPQPPAKAVQHRPVSPRYDPDDDDDSYKDLWVEIDNGFYYDPIDGEYHGTPPEARDDWGDDEEDDFLDY